MTYSTQHLLWDIKDEVTAEKYWDFYKHLRGAQQLSDDFKDLLVKMLSKNPDARPSIAEIKAQSFFNGPVPTLAEIIENGVYRRSILVKIRALEIKLMKETAASLKPGVRKD